MTARVQTSPVERAADLFTSMKATGGMIAVRDLAQISGDHELADGELFEALAFLEANGLIEVRTVVLIAGERGEVAR